MPFQKSKQLIVKCKTIVALIALKCKYYGRIVWLKNPDDGGKPKIDNNNPDKSKRDHAIVGLIILKGFRFDGDDE
jgi:hypothetical protein